MSQAMNSLALDRLTSMEDVDSERIENHAASRFGLCSLSEHRAGDMTGRKTGVGRIGRRWMEWRRLHEDRNG
jgi:hypothetical protein